MNISIDIKGFKEEIRVMSNTVNISLIMVSGKEGKHFVCVSPSLMVSGYGSTEEEAKESFTHNMEVFCKDIIEASANQRNAYLKSLGFVPGRIHNKRFSKTYIDENGVLKGFDPATIKTKRVKASC